MLVQWPPKRSATTESKSAACFRRASRIQADATRHRSSSTQLARRCAWLLSSVTSRRFRLVTFKRSLQGCEAVPLGAARTVLHHVAETNPHLGCQLFSCVRCLLAPPQVTMMATISTRLGTESCVPEHFFTREPLVQVLVQRSGRRLARMMRMCAR